jgi:uncharacterized protein (TIGR02996 family)
MAGREDFLSRLERNENDAQLRYAYADWLEEQCDYDESIRQRQWCKAKAWMEAICEESARYDVHEDEGEIPITYQEVIEFATSAIDSRDRDDDIYVYCGRLMELSYMLSDNRDAFWKNWSILTGRPLPENVSEKSTFRCAC